MRRRELEHSLRAASGWCLEIHDLAVSKLVVGREKDIEFVRGLLKHNLAEPKRIEGLLSTLPSSEDVRDRVRGRLNRVISGAK